MYCATVGWDTIEYLVRHLAKEWLWCLWNLPLHCRLPSPKFIILSSASRCLKKCSWRRWVQTNLDRRQVMWRWVQVFELVRGWRLKILVLSGFILIPTKRSNGKYENFRVFTPIARCVDKIWNHLLMRYSATKENRLKAGAWRRRIWKICLWTRWPVNTVENLCSRPI